MKLLNIYHRHAANAGDLASSPLKYFSYDCESFELGAASSDTCPSADAVIVGGGGLISNNTFNETINLALQTVAGPKILWGAGFNKRSYPFNFQRELDGLAGFKSEVRGFLRRGKLLKKSTWQESLEHDAKQYPTLDSRYTLIGVRDWGTSYRWVPCASCMHPILDEARSRHPAKDLLILDHPMFFKINTMRACKASNIDTPFESIISLIADAKVILTSSYHAAYWGILLSRRVVVVPWSTKFMRLKWNVEFAYDLDGVRRAIARAKSFPNALDEAREANKSFAVDVSRLLEAKVTW
jgi:hypothetical protein